MLLELLLVRLLRRLVSLHLRRGMTTIAVQREALVLIEVVTVAPCRGLSLAIPRRVALAERRYLVVVLVALRCYVGGGGDFLLMQWRLVRLELPWRQLGLRLRLR